MPPKRKLSMPVRQSQRMKRPKNVGPPVTIDVDEIADEHEEVQAMPEAVTEAMRDSSDEAMSEDVPITTANEVNTPVHDDEAEDYHSAVGDDCEVAGDEDCDAEVRYADEDVDGNRNHLGVEETDCNNFEAVFGEDAREDANSVSDGDSGDDIWDDGSIPEPITSDDDDESEVQGATAVRRVCAESPEEYLKLGKTFNCPEDFKNVVLRYSLKTKYDIMLYRAQSLRIGAKCASSEGNCQWRCYCSYDKRKRKMQIKVYVSEHSCVRSGYTKMLKQGTIGKLFKERLRQNPRLTPAQMVDEITREYNLTVTENQCAKAKTKVLKDRVATHEEHFSRLWDYQAEIFRSNPGTTFDIETLPGPTVGSLTRFSRLFICFTAQRETWKNTCRPILGIDGAFLKWDIRGHLLAAVGRDGDNRIVPVAWAVVEIENDDNWDWFMRKLSGSLNLQDGRNLAVISDKQAGLVKAIHSVLPAAEHRQCARHIMENWRKKSHDMELQRIFWKIARSNTEGEYVTHMQELKGYNPGAFATLLNTNPRTWSRAFFRLGSCCNDNLNNLSESFNRTIRLARKKPLLDLLEDIRRQCMVRNAKRHVIASQMKTRFTKRAHTEIEKMIEGSQNCVRWMARHDKHEVRLGDDSFEVDMNELTCGCRKWQLTGIPCVHATSVIIGQKKKVEDYVSDWYTSEKWLQTYADGIGPVQGSSLWPRLERIGVLLPPWRKGHPGRPKNYARRQGLNETSSSKLSRKNRVMTCSNCKEEGHNTRGCKNQRVTTPPRRPRGRPRKSEEPRIILSAQGNLDQQVGQDYQQMQASVNQQIQESQDQPIQVSQEMQESEGF